MISPLEQKSSLDEIKARFDNDVERFSNLDTGQTATINAPSMHKNSCFAAFGAIKAG
jgi:tRNA (cmo5U34)-methyltransferase